MGSNVATECIPLHFQKCIVTYIVCVAFIQLALFLYVIIVIDCTVEFTVLSLLLGQMLM